MDMSDPRVPLILAHGKDCRKAIVRREPIPDLPSELKDLTGIDLREVNLSHANLTGADFGSASLTGANLSFAKLTSANLGWVDLAGANFGGANLRDAFLSHADLRSANLRSADLTQANLTAADLTGAELGGAGLGFADLANAKITQDQLNSAGYVNVPQDGYPKEVAEKVILLHAVEPVSWKREAKKRLVVEFRADGKLHVKTPIFKY